MTFLNALDLPTNWELIGREIELQRVIQALADDEDLLIAGVPGSGRRTLIQRAAEEFGALVIEIDCIRAMDGKSFVKLLYESFAQVFHDSKVQAICSEWVKEAYGLFVLNKDNSGRPCLEPAQPLSQLRRDEDQDKDELWQAFMVLLRFPQFLAEKIGKRVVLVLRSLPHIRCWDRQRDKREWEKSLRREIEEQEKVSYVIVATIAETSAIVKTSSSTKNSSTAKTCATDNDSDSDTIETIELAPLSDDILAGWIRDVLRKNDLAFNPLESGLEMFLRTVQGHYGDARALARRLLAAPKTDERIGENQVRRTIKELLKDFSAVFESLLILLPDSQAQLLECLALYPTDKPQSRDYIQKHSLSKGGTLQNALASLQQKGLIYGPEQRYRLALPLLAEWIRQQLG